MVCAKALRQEYGGCVQGTARRPVRLEEGQKVENSVTEAWLRGGMVSSDHCKDSAFQ